MTLQKSSFAIKTKNDDVFEKGTKKPSSFFKADNIATLLFPWII